MRTHFTNAFYGVLDYVAWPAGMLAVAPVAVRALGIDRFGIWMVASSAISAGAIVASGFGDANIRYVAMQRATGNHEALCRAVRSTMGIHLVLGSALALAGWLLAPGMTYRLVAAHSALRTDCLWSLRIACLLLLVRALESVCISTQRAFEQYGAAVRISIFGRLLSLAAAAVLPLIWPSVTNVLIATAVISICSLGAQVAKLSCLLQILLLTPRFDRDATRALLGFGKFTWMQSVSGLLLGQMDRLITGAWLGAAAVSSYALCVQLSQPVYGLTAAGLHFLFPRIAAQYARNDTPNLQRTVFLAIIMNWAAVVLGTAILLIFGNTILRAWGGPVLAQTAGEVLPVVLCSTALSALSIAGSYAMLAIGRVQIVTWLNLAAAVVMILAIVFLLPSHGIRGMALARLVYGPITLGLYIPLFTQLLRGSISHSDSKNTFRPLRGGMMQPHSAARIDDVSQRPDISAQCTRRDSRAGVNVLGVSVDPLDLEHALSRISDLLRRHERGYVCAVSVHGILEARRHPRVAQAFASASIVMPDGRPTVWVGRMQGQHAIRQVTGPDLMAAIFSHSEFAGCSHFFYGGKEGVAEELAAMWKQKFPGTRIAGTWTPPFRDLTLAEEADLIRLLNRRRPDIIWVGISTPRQELLMHRLLPHLNRGLLFGVGAAFDFHTGRIRDCAPWIKRIGVQWLHRLLQDPRRLWRRNLYNATFLWHIALQLSGVTKYRLDLLHPPAHGDVTPHLTCQRTSAASISSLGDSA